MRTFTVIAVVITIGLAWSFASMANLVPFDSAEMSSAKIKMAKVER
jgi:hypothetical protein